MVSRYHRCQLAGRDLPPGSEDQRRRCCQAMAVPEDLGWVLSLCLFEVEDDCWDEFNAVPREEEKDLIYLYVTGVFK